MINYEQRVIENLRLNILQALHRAADYRINEHLLAAVLIEIGIPVSAHRLRAELHWMGEIGLLEIERQAGITVARLTRRGADAAQGLAETPGVARPLPAE